jgi:hypothetical protein
MLHRLLRLAAFAVLALALAPASARSATSCDPVDPAVCLQPFPNDAFTERAPTATGRRLALRNALMPRNREGKPIEASDYNHSDGFSPGQAIVTRVPGLDTLAAFRRNRLPPIDDPARSLRRKSRVAVINARTGRRHLVWAEIDANPRKRSERNLIIRPARNFREGERYIVALSDLRRASGRRIRPSAAFQRLRESARRRTRAPAYTGRAWPSRARHMRSIFRTLERAQIRRRDLYRAWDFTVASAPSTTGRMLSIRDRAFAALGDTDLANRTIEGSSPQFVINPDLPGSSLPGPPGASPLPGIDGVVDYPDGPLARQVSGRIVVPCFLDAPGCAPGAQFRYAPGSNGRRPMRIPGNTALYDFTCNIPRHEGPLRPALYGHGLLGSQSEINQGQLKALGAEHGFVFCAVDWNGMSTKDLPTVLGVLQDLSRFPALTDHVQQGFLGFLYLGRAMLHDEGLFAHPAFAGIDVDRRELYFDGNSQGGIYGGALTAVSPDIRRSVLGVPGMNYSTLLRRSVDFDAYAHGEFGVDTPLGLYDNYPSELERPLLLGLIQMLWDRSDPNGYAQHMTTRPLPNTPAHDVLLHVGFGDHQVADVTTEVQARTIGARVHRPLLEPGRERYRGRPYPRRRAGPPLFGVASLGGPGYRATGSGVVFWDIGPLRTENGESRGTPPPPAANIPPRQGNDPHEEPRRSVAARRQKSAFLRPDGRIVDVCGGPCFAGGWTGSGG